VSVRTPIRQVRYRLEERSPGALAAIVRDTVHGLMSAR
jgi:hypothetical protein